MKGAKQSRLHGSNVPCRAMSAVSPQFSFHTLLHSCRSEIDFHPHQVNGIILLWSYRKTNKRSQRLTSAGLRAVPSAPSKRTGRTNALCLRKEC